LRRSCVVNTTPRKPVRIRSFRRPICLRVMGMDAARAGAGIALCSCVGILVAQAYRHHAKRHRIAFAAFVPLVIVAERAGSVKHVPDAVQVVVQLGQADFDCVHLYHGNGCEARLSPYQAATSFLASATNHNCFQYLRSIFRTWTSCLGLRKPLL
jgi:hypothetical protein